MMYFVLALACALAVLYACISGPEPKVSARVGTRDTTKDTAQEDTCQPPTCYPDIHPRAP